MKEPITEQKPEARTVSETADLAAAPRSDSSVLSQPLMLGFIGVLVALTLFLFGLGAGFGLARLDMLGTVSDASAGLNPIANQGRVDAQIELDPEFDTFWEDCAA